MLISQLFWEQSQPWEKIASEHITKVANICKDFVYAVLQYVAPAEFLPRIKGLSVDTALKNSMLAAQDEMKKVLTDKARHPMTYNRELITHLIYCFMFTHNPCLDYFTTTVQKIRQRKHQKMTKDATTATTTRYYDHSAQQNKDKCEPLALEKAMNDAIEQDMDTFSSQEALDNQRAYYKVCSSYSISLSPNLTNTPHRTSSNTS
jgi:hypothetical protein